jgi:pimeloyl-ACP methyl ester carboxylesterase
MWLDVAGKRIFAGTGGVPFDPAKPVIAFIHGAGMDHSVWALQDRALAHAGFAVLSFDLPGHGRSEGEALASIAQMADWLRAALDAAKVGEANLVGHSMGALVALSFAARHPCRAMALLGAAAAMPVHEGLLKAASDDVPAAIAMMTNWGFSAEAALGGSATPGLWLVGGAASLIARARPGVLAADLAACNFYGDGAADAARVKGRALVIAGERDRMAPASAGRALAASLNGRAEVLRGAGHMLMAERPGEVADLLREWLG